MEAEPPIVPPGERSRFPRQILGSLSRESSDNLPSFDGPNRGMALVLFARFIYGDTTSTAELRYGVVAQNICKEKPIRLE